MNNIKVNTKDYKKNIDGDFIHKSITTNYPKLNDMIDENGNLTPLFITKRSGNPDYWGFCSSDGDEYKVEFTSVVDLYLVNAPL